MSLHTLLKDIKTTSSGGSNDSFPRWLTKFDDKIFFSALGDGGDIELWATDGTETGTKLVANLGGSFVSSNPLELTSNDYQLYFTGYNIEQGRELWYISKGDYSTRLVADINPGIGSSNPKNIVFYGNAQIFSAKSVDNNRYLWKSDQETYSLSKDHILPDDSLITIFKDEIYFVGNFKEEGDALWKFDGNDFTRIFDYFPDSSQDTVFRELKVSGNYLYFTASSSDSDGLIVTDGSPNNTIIISDNLRDGFTSPSSLVDVDGALYFTASSGYGRDLWKSDGTKVGTVIADRLNKNRGINSVKELTVVGGKIYYAGKYNFDKELWFHDTEESTSSIVANINSSNSSLKAIDNSLTKFGNNLLFSADDGLHGEELWITNGNSSGTFRLSDVSSGLKDSDILEPTVLNEKIIFRADSNKYGAELFVVDSSDSSFPDLSILQDNIYAVSMPNAESTPDNSEAESLEAEDKSNSDSIFSGDSEESDQRNDSQICKGAVLRSRPEIRITPPRATAFVRGSKGDRSRYKKIYFTDFSPNFSKKQRVGGFANFSLSNGESGFLVKKKNKLIVGIDSDRNKKFNREHDIIIGRYNATKDNLTHNIVSNHAKAGNPGLKELKHGLLTSNEFIENNKRDSYIVIGSEKKIRLGENYLAKEDYFIDRLHIGMQRNPSMKYFYDWGNELWMKDSSWYVTGNGYECAM